MWCVLRPAFMLVAVVESARPALRPQPVRKLVADVAEPAKRLFLFLSIVVQEAEGVVEAELEVLDAHGPARVVEVAQAGILHVLRVVLLEQPGERRAPRGQRLGAGVADRLLDAGGVVARLLQMLLERRTKLLVPHLV